jgi:hypothetical protein
MPMQFVGIDDKHGNMKSFWYNPPGRKWPTPFLIHFEGNKQQLECYLSAQAPCVAADNPVAIGYVICRNHDLGMHVTEPKGWGLEGCWIVIRERLNANGWVIDREHIAVAKNMMEAAITAGEFRNTVPTAYIRIYRKDLDVIAKEVIAITKKQHS